MWRGKDRGRIGTEKGSILLMVGVAMVVMLGVSAIAIDLVNLYLARTQAQRAADAAALAGAKSFVTSGCATSGCTPGGIQETMATQQATDIAAQNNIAGQPATVSGVAFSYPTPLEPQITVTSGRSISTFFAKVFGVRTVNVSATATAEAYNPAGGGNTSLGQQCLRPFLVPDCDPVHTSNKNGSCPSGNGPQGYFFNPNSSPAAIANPGVYPSGIQGMPWQLHSNAGPSQWYLVGFGGAPPSSGSALRDHIAMCTPAILSCGDTLTTANGVNLGPVEQGTQMLINATGDGLNKGQDSIDTTIGPPFPITGGSNNPNPALRGKVFYDYSQSTSVVTVPVYSGGNLPPGGTQVQIVGYMQAFIKDIVHQGQDDFLDVVILNISSCGGSSPGGGGSSNTVVASAGSPVPIRLIRTN